MKVRRVHKPTLDEEDDRDWRLYNYPDLYPHAEIIIAVAKRDVPGGFAERSVWIKFNPDGDAFDWRQAPRLEAARLLRWLRR